MFNILVGSLSKVLKQQGLLFLLCTEEFEVKRRARQSFTVAFTSWSRFLKNSGQLNFLFIYWHITVMMPRCSLYMTIKAETHRRTPLTLYKLYTIKSSRK